MKLFGTSKIEGNNLKIGGLEAKYLAETLEHHYMLWMKS